MKKLVLISAFFAISMSGITAAFSMEREISGKTGFMLMDMSGADDIIPVSVVYSQTLDNVAPNLWIEEEFNYGLIGCDYDTIVFETKISGDIDIWTIAGYAVYKHPFKDDVYLKGKVDLLYESVKKAALIQTSAFPWVSVVDSRSMTI